MIYLPKRTRLSRRALLRNASALALAAPVFRHLDDDATAADESPRRLIMYYTSNGPMNMQGPVSGNETDFEFKPWWEPLARHREKGIFLSHLSVTAAATPKMVGHSAGGQVFDGWGADNYSTDGESIHHIIEKRMQAEGRAAVKSSVIWGTTNSGHRSPFSTGKNQPMDPETNPRRAWAEVFSSFMSPNPSAQTKLLAERQLMRRQSMLDYAHRDCLRLQTSLGAEGTRLLDAHCTTLRSTEQKLVDGFTLAGSCEAPPEPDNLGGNAEDLDRQVELFNDVIVASLACELTHIVGFQTGGSGANNRLPRKYDVEKNDGHHSWTHKGGSQTKRDSLGKYTRYYSEMIASLVDKLSTTVDISGRPLIESTVLHQKGELGGTEGSEDIHPESNIPELILGGGDAFKLGRYIRCSSPDKGKKGAGFKESGLEAARILLAMKHYMGLTDVTSVGRSKDLKPFAPLYG